MFRKSKRGSIALEGLVALIVGGIFILTISGVLYSMERIRTREEKKSEIDEYIDAIYMWVKEEESQLNKVEKGIFYVDIEAFLQMQRDINEEFLYLEEPKKDYLKISVEKENEFVNRILIGYCGEIKVEKVGYVHREKT